MQNVDGPKDFKSQKKELLEKLKEYEWNYS